MASFSQPASAKMLRSAVGSSISEPRLVLNAAFTRSCRRGSMECRLRIGMRLQREGKKSMKLLRLKYSDCVKLNSPFFDPFNNGRARARSSELVLMDATAQDAQQQTDSPDASEKSAEESSSEGPGYHLVTSMRTPYSALTIVDIPSNADGSLAGARLLLLDDSGHIQSLYYEDRFWTGSYWDEFASIVPLLPEGPVGFLGLVCASSFGETGRG